MSGGGKGGCPPFSLLHSKARSRSPPPPRALASALVLRCFVFCGASLLRQHLRGCLFLKGILKGVLKRASALVQFGAVAKRLALHLSGSSSAPAIPAGSMLLRECCCCAGAESVPVDICTDMLQEAAG